jgi:hypothetical protein
MVENKTETDTYRLGNFLTWNVETCNLEGFHDSVGWSKDRFNGIIAQQGKADNKCARLARSIRKDLEARSRLVGFLGYSNFDNPVKVSSKSAISIITAIRKLKGREGKGRAWRCPPFRCRSAMFN